MLSEFVEKSFVGSSETETFHGTIVPVILSVSEPFIRNQRKRR